jgi:hypothetical protein
MKLIYCTSCDDVIKLTPRKRKCNCGKSAGVYNNNIILFGEAVLLNIDDEHLKSCIVNRYTEGNSIEFYGEVEPVFKTGISYR